MKIWGTKFPLAPAAPASTASIFALCGSSARKIRRSSRINLLGGRALRYELLGLTARELGDDFSLEHMLNAGPLPRHYMSNKVKPLLRAYVQDYLREEVMEEGLTRNLPVLNDFLRVAAIGDTEVVNMTHIARETGMAVSTVRAHFGILEDTLLGAFLPSFTLRPKRRTISKKNTPLSGTSSSCAWNHAGAKQRRASISCPTTISLNRSGPGNGRTACIDPGRPPPSSPLLHSVGRGLRSPSPVTTGSSIMVQCISNSFPG